MTLINRFPSRRVKVDGIVWRFANTSSIAWDALSLSPLNFDMVVTGYPLIIVPSGPPRLVGRPCLVSLPLLFFSSLVPRLRVVGAFLLSNTVCALTRLRFSTGAQLVECSLCVRKVTGSFPCRRCCFILVACTGLGLTLLP